MNIRKIISIWMFVSAGLVFLDVLTDSVIINILGGIAVLFGLSIFSLFMISSIVYHSRKGGDSQ